MSARINSGNYRGVVTLQSRKLAENKGFLAFCTESRILRHLPAVFRKQRVLFLLQVKDDTCIQLDSFLRIPHKHVVDYL